MDQTGVVANPAHHGQLNNKENNIFPVVPVRVLQFGLARRAWPSRPESARSFFTLKPNLVLTLGLSPAFRNGICVTQLLGTNIVFFKLTDRHSTIPSNNIRGCQSGTWSQRGTKVNGSHHGDNPLLRPTGIQIATKRCVTLQAMHGADQYGSSNLLTP